MSDNKKLDELAITVQNKLKDTLRLRKMLKTSCDEDGNRIHINGVMMLEVLHQSERDLGNALASQHEEIVASLERKTKKENNENGSERF